MHQILYELETIDSKLFFEFLFNPRIIESFSNVNMSSNKNGSFFTLKGSKWEPLLGLENQIYYSKCINF